MIGHLDTAFGNGISRCIFATIGVISPAFYVVCIACSIKSLCLEHIVDCFMAAVSNRKVVIPGIKNKRLRFCIVITAQILEICRDCDAHTFARLKDGSFAVVE